MYYTVLGGIRDITSRNGLPRLPPYILDKFVFDENRRESLARAREWLSRGENILITGRAGTGKTAFLAILLKEALGMGYRVGKIINGETVLNRHTDEGIILFYDDIPRMETRTARSIVENNARAIVATAREEELEELKRKLGEKPDKIFRIIRMEAMSKKKLIEILNRHAEAEGIIINKEAAEIVAEKAQGLPVYIWQAIRELVISRQRELTMEYAERMPAGMLEYVDKILWDTLGGEEYMEETLLTLITMTQMPHYETHQDLINTIFIEATKTIRDIELKPISLIKIRTLRKILRYMVRTAQYSFKLPHDSWADVLKGKSKGPIAPEIASINHAIPKTEQIWILKNATIRAIKQIQDEERKTALQNQLVRLLKKLEEENKEPDPKTALAIGEIALITGEPTNTLWKTLQKREREILELAKTTTAKTAIAGAYIDLWKLEKAEELLEETLEQEPENTEALELLALVKYEQHKRDEALEIIEKTPQEKRTTMQLLIQARIHEWKGEKERAEKVYGEIIRREARTTKEKLAEAIAHRELGQTEEARRILGEILEANPECTEALIELGITYNKTNNHDEAIKHLKKAIEINPNNPKAHLNLGMVYSEKGDYDEAIKHYEKTLGVNPNDAEAMIRLGLTYYKKHEYEKALEHISKALETNPNIQKLFGDLMGKLLEMGAHFDIEGNLDKAIECYKIGIKIDPKDYRVWWYLGNIYFEKRDYDYAIEYYRKTIEINPNFAAAWYDMGAAYYNKGDYDKAIECYRKAIEVSPDFALAWAAMGDAYCKKCEFDEAIKCYKKAIEISPGLFEAWNAMGVAYRRKGELDKAIECYKRAIEINPNDDIAWYNMGLAYYDKGELDKAIECYKRAIEINPRLAVIWYNMGLAYYDKGEYDKARECFKQACKLEFKKACKELHSL